MKISLKHIFLFVSFYFFGQLIFGQQNKIDSLLSALSKTQADTNKVKTLNALAWELKDSKPDSAMAIGKLALDLANKLNWIKGRLIGEKQLGVFHYTKGQYEIALNNYKKALALSELLISSEDKALTKTGKTQKSKTLSNIGNVYNSQGNYPEALEYYLKGLKIAEDLGDKKQVGTALGTIGIVHEKQADYEKALEYYLKALKITKEVGDRQGTSRMLSCIAIVCEAQADYPKALEYYLMGLKIVEELGDQLQISRSLDNIGSIYHLEANYPKALEYHLKALEIVEKFGNKQGIDITLCNIGHVYSSLADYPKAIEYYLKALKIAEELQDKNQIARCHLSIGNVFKAQADQPKTLEHYSKALKIAEEIQDKQMIGISLGNLGSLNLSCGKYSVAEGYLKQALIIAKEIGAPEIEKNQEENLSQLYEKTNRPALAFEHYKKYIALRDTIFSEENSKKLVRTEMKHDFEKKEAVIKEQQEKERAVAEEKSKFQQIVIVSVIFGLALVIVFAFFVFRTLKITRKQKVIIEEKQKEIIDSIKYARRIQRALITNEKYIEKSLNKLQGKS